CPQTRPAPLATPSRMWSADRPRQQSRLVPRVVKAPSKSTGTSFGASNASAVASTWFGLPRPASAQKGSRVPPTVEVAGAVPAGAVALVVAVTPGTGDPAAAKLGRGAAADLASFGADPAALLAVLAREKTKGNVGEVGQLPVGSRLVLAAGLGDGTPRD